jgi:predicted P-loop ATPase
MENTIWCDLLRNGIKCTQNDLHSILTSDFSKDYDPFVSYFESLPAWDGKVDYIAQLATTVVTTHPELWERCLRKWIVAMVACAILPDVENHTVLILNSAQGTGKTTWCTKLIPPELGNYRYSGVPRFDSRDMMLTISECILVNLDELTTLSERDLNRLKELTSKSVIRERRAYGRNNETYIRRASFIASANTNQILNDLTGARRFLCFNATAIDYMSPIDHKNIFSQAVALLNSDFRYWLDDADIQEINENNENFRIRFPEEELFYVYFRKCEEGEEGVWLTATQIMDRLCINTHLMMTHGGTIRIGMLLQKGDFASYKKRNKHLYQVMEISREEVDKEKRQQPEESPKDENKADNQTELDF